MSKKTDQRTLPPDAIVERESDCEFHPRWRKGLSIVFTSGCFDILHAGHVLFLQKARSLGDCLVVALNDDRSVQRLKGPDRPIYPVSERAEVMASLTCVDRIIVFSGERPLESIRRIKPDIYVKDAPYSSGETQLPEAQLVEALGGAVRYLPRIPGFSSTAVLEAIQYKRGPIRLPPGRY